MKIVGKMAKVVVVDAEGRVVIPKEVRERLGLAEGSRLLLVELSDDTIALRKLDARKILEAIAREVREKRVNLEKIEREVEEEADRVASRRIEEMLAGH